MKSTIHQKTCTCGRPGCPVTFDANNSRKYATSDCSEYARKAKERIRAAGYRKNGTDTRSQQHNLPKLPRTVTKAFVPSSAGVKDGKTRKPCADWPERFERIRAKYGVKLPKPGEYTI